MPADLRLSYDNLKLHAKTPIWMFSGLGVVAIIAIGVTINSKQQDKRVSNWVMNPKAGDILHVKEKDSVYTLYKITKVEKDSVYLVTDNYQTNDESDVSSLEAKGFDTVVNVLSKSEYSSMNTEGKILDVDRN